MFKGLQGSPQIDLLKLDFEDFMSQANTGFLALSGQHQVYTFSIDIDLMTSILIKVIQIKKIQVWSDTSVKKLLDFLTNMSNPACTGRDILCQLE